MAAAATAVANAAPALPPLTARRKAKNRSNAWRMRLAAPHAACRPWMMSSTAPAAGMSSEISFSISRAISAGGMAALIPSHTIRPIWATVIPPRTSRFHTAEPMPTTCSTLSLNQPRTDVLNAPQRWLRTPSISAAPRLRSHWPGPAAMSRARAANCPSISMACRTLLMIPWTAEATKFTAAR